MRFTSIAACATLVFARYACGLGFVPDDNPENIVCSYNPMTGESYCSDGDCTIHPETGEEYCVQDNANLDKIAEELDGSPIAKIHRANPLLDKRVTCMPSAKLCAAHCVSLGYCGSGCDFEGFCQCYCSNSDFAGQKCKQTAVTCAAPV